MSPMLLGRHLTCSWVIGKTTLRDTRTGGTLSPSAVSLKTPASILTNAEILVIGIVLFSNSKVLLSTTLTGRAVKRFT